MRPGLRIGGRLRHLLPVALCALAGHAALYGTLVPSTGDHAYLVWYEPLVAGLSLVALATLVCLLLAVLGDEPLRRRVVSLLPPASTHGPASVRAVRLALASVAFLATQETIERSLTEGRLAPAAFASSQILLALFVITVAAGVVSVVERSCSRLIELVARRPAAMRHEFATVVLFPPARPLTVRRRHPLAQLRGLRAPPLPV